MSVIRLYRGGIPLPQYPNCDGSSLWDIPSANRIDQVYHRGHFTATAVFNPVPDVRAMNTDYKDARAVSAAAVGDILEMFVMPPMHKATDVAVQVKLPMDSSYAPSAGFTFNVVARHYTDGADTPSSQEVLITGVSGGADQWKHVDYVHVTNAGERVVFGIVITALPTTAGYTLADMQALVGIAISCVDFDVQQQM